MVMMEMDPVNLQVEELRKRLANLKTQQLNEAKHKLVGYGRLDPGAMAYERSNIDKAQADTFGTQSTNIALNELKNQADYTGMYNGAPTQQKLGQLLPLMLSGNLSSDYFGKDYWKGGFKNEQQLASEGPEYAMAKKYGYANPYEMNVSIENPEWYNTQKYTNYTPEVQSQIDQLEASLASDQQRLGNENSDELDARIRARIIQKQHQLAALRRQGGA